MPCAGILRISCAFAISVLLAAGWGFVGSCAAFDRSHAALDVILREHVVRGRVDYRHLAREPSPLRSYLQSLAAVTPAELASASHNDQLAFWINAYNAFTLMTIAEHYPLSRGSFVGLVFPANSIWQIPNVWKDMRWRAAGRAVSLDLIENEIIRPQFREPRIHFALVCASRSCPDLRSEAYRGDRLDEQLEDQTRRFLADVEKGVRAEPARGILRLSKIFRWYRQDFELAGGAQTAPNDAGRPGVLAFVAHHSTDGRLKSLARKPEVLVAYLDYDWSLNEGVPR